MATTPLNSITAPTGNVSANDYKITNVTAATEYKDAMRYGQDLRWQWVNARVNSDILMINSPHKVVFDYITSPSLSSVDATCYWNTDYVFLGFGGASYLVDI